MKKLSIILTAIFVLVSIASFVLNIYKEKFFASSYFPFNPKQKNVFQYGIIQSLNTTIEDIKEIEVEGIKEYELTLRAETDENDTESTLKAVVPLFEDKIDSALSNVKIWSYEEEKWYTYSEKPQTLTYEIKKEDRLFVQSNKFVEKEVEKSTVKILSIYPVEKDEN